MAKRAKIFENLLVQAAKGGWVVYNGVNSMFKDNPGFTPKWSDKPLLKSYEKEKPPLGWPRSPLTPALPSTSAGPGDPRQQIVDGNAAARDPAQREEGRRDQGTDHQSGDGQDPRWSRTAPFTATLRT